MPSTIKTIQELSVLQKQIMDAAKASEAKAIGLQEAGDQLGAAKEAQKAIDYAALLDEATMGLNDYRSKLDTQIRTGSILTDDLSEPTATLPTTSEGINKKLQDALSVSLGSEVDLTSGLGVKLRRDLAFLQPASKEEYLKTQFPPERVVTKNVLGAPVTMVQDDNGKWTPIDEFETTGKDFVDVVGEIGPTIGSMVGGLGGFGLQRSPIGVATGSAFGAAAVGTAQDVIARRMLGVGETFSESLPRRVTESVVAAPIEYATMKLGAPIGRGVAKAAVGQTTKRAELFAEAEEFFAKNGYNTGLSRIARGSLESQEKMMRAAQRLPNSALGRDVLYGAKRIERFMDDAIKPGQLPDVLYDDTLKALRHEHDQLVKQIAISDEVVARELRNSIDSEMYRRMSRPVKDESASAQYVRTIVEQAKTNAEKAKNNIYNSFYEKANQLVSVDGDELANVIEEAYFKGQSRPPAIAKEIKKLRQRNRNSKIIEKLQKQVDSGSLKQNTQESFERKIAELREISGPLNASQLDETFRNIRDLAPTGPIAGTGSGELKRVSKIAENVAQQFRDDVYRKTIDPVNGTSLYQEWSEATTKMQDFQEFVQSSIADLIAIDGREPKLTSRELLTRVFSDPDKTNQVLTAVKRNDPNNFGPFLLNLQETYLNRIGLNGTTIGSNKQIKFDEGVIRTLFGAENPRHGENMVSKMRLLQQSFERQKIDPSKISLNDVKDLESALSKDSIQEVIQAIGNKAQKQQEIESLTRNILIKDAINGHRESIVRGEFPAALFDAPPDQVRKIFGKFTAKDQKAMRADYMEHLFSRYPGNPDATIGRLQLFDGPRLIEDAKRNPKIRKNLEVVIGKEKTDTLFSAAQLTEATQTVPKGQDFRVTGVVTEKGARAFAPIQAIMASLGDRYTAALYRSGDLFPLLKKLGQKELTEEQYNTAMALTFESLLLTSKGVQSLTETGKYEPEWAHRLGRTTGWMAKEVEFGKEFGIRSKPESSQ